MLANTPDLGPVSNMFCFHEYPSPPFIILRGARTARVILFFSNRVYFIKDVSRTLVGRRYHQGTLVLWRTHPPYKVFSSLLITHRGTIATFYRDTNLHSVSDAQGSAFFLRRELRIESTAQLPSFDRR